MSLCKKRPEDPPRELTSGVMLKSVMNRESGQGAGSPGLT